MNNHLRLKKQINKLEKLLNLLTGKDNYPDKLKILNKLPIVQNYVIQTGPIQSLLKNLTPESEFAIKSIIAIGQAPLIFNIKNLNETLFRKLIALLEQLLDIESFYFYIGGIIGYHVTMLTLISTHSNPTAPSSNHARYIHPEGLDLGEDSVEVRQAIRWGIENTENIAMIYPLGGAGDRLNLLDEKTGDPLPAALLPFLGQTLLEGMLRDLQSREYLSFKLFEKQHFTPIAIMTSAEKNNHAHILNICKIAHWFGRSSDSFYFFIQPLVPVITCEGNWSLYEPLSLTLKPCGHGVLWKLAEESGVFKWLESQGKRQCLIRQINNPLAGTDHALFALMGIGCQKQKAFGFLSCERLLHSDEGINVLIEKKTSHGYRYCLTNIEYTEFTQKGIEEAPTHPGSCFSTYPTNTNILFANIPLIRKILKVCPFPGQLVNMKSKVPYLNLKGQLSFVSGGRLESTMQNIADNIIDHFPQRLSKKEYKDALSSFILYNHRSKTISTTKKSYQKDTSAFATPEQAFYDLLSNHYLLLKRCGFELPTWRNIEEHLAQGPACILIFHPALGPLFSIITQKIRKGRLALGSELQLEIAELDIEYLSLTGSLVIHSPAPLGIHDRLGILRFGQESRCTLRHVTIENQGIDRSVDQHYWKNEITRKEAVKILLHEGAEFLAEDISLEGSHSFEVPPHHRLSLFPKEKGKWREELVPIQKPTWYWLYSFDDENNIKLKKIKTVK